jgi:ATP-dependent Lhr-like helicase
MGEGMFGTLHPSLGDILKRRGWDETPIQKSAIPILASGNDGLVIAPTGSGKTMAAILPLLDRCLREEWQGLSILYITPLRALNRDVDRRLTKLAEEVGLSVGIRHGDTTPYQRQKQVKKPPNILITTPETFQLMFTGIRLRELLRTVKVVIIDEVHDMASGERGWQLSVGISRLSAMKGSKCQMVGLSATVGNPEQVARWLSPNAIPIIEMSERETILSVEAISPIADDDIGAIDLGISPRAHSTLRGLCEIIRNEPPCLVFVNSRNSAETISQRLAAMATDLRIGVHHGSLAVETRTQMEDELRNGELQALVCTSSLELGIDVGSVNRIIQVRSPRSVDRMLQRVGRADHRLGGIGRGHVLGWEVDDIAESAVIARRAMIGDIEAVEWRNRPLSIAANQMVMMVHSWGAITPVQFTNIMNETLQFEGWRPEDSDNIAKVLADGWIIKYSSKPSEIPWYRWPAAVWNRLVELSDEELPERPDLRAGDVSEKLKALKFNPPPPFEKGWIARGSRTRDWVTNHLSMIPDKKSYRVRDAVSRRNLGSVDEAFVLSLSDGGEEEDGRSRRFVMAGRTWMVIDADPEQSELLVAPVSDVGNAPHWLGELPPTPAAIAREIGQLRRTIAGDLGWNDTQVNPTTPNPLNQMPEFTDHPLDGESRGLLAEIISAHLEVTGTIPSDKLITIEDRENTLIINCCHGSRINEALGHFLLAMSSTKSGKWGRLITEPTRISLQVKGVTPAQIIDWLSNTPPEALEGVLSVTLPNSREVRWRFAQVAKTFGILRHGVDPRRINLQALLKKYRGTIVMEEVLSKLFHERMDTIGAAEVLQAIRSGHIEIEVTAPGPLGLSSRHERDLMLPNWDDKQVRERLKHRLLNERAVTCCLKCHSTRRFRVARYGEMDDVGKCLRCGGRMLACAREGMEKMLVTWVTSDDIKDRNRMQKNAQAVASRKQEAIIALMGRGIGEATCQRIMRKVQRGNMDGLLEAIHLSELEYARTRRFWA